LRRCGTLRGVNPDPSLAPARRPRRAWLYAGIAGAAAVLVAATVAITLVAVRSDSPTPAAQQAAPATTAAATPPAATTGAATPAVPAALTFGVKADSGKGTAVAHAYKQPVATKAPKPDEDGFEWGAADVEVCARSAGYLNNGSWVLVYADHTRIEASSIGYQQFPKPEYPSGDTDVVAGQCIRGWITYPVPAGKKPSAVHYQPQGFQADWLVT
jgi:hypothetical protein